jgi:acyl carrier protein
MITIEDRLRDILIDDLFVQLAKDHILVTHSLRNDLGIDSVGFVELRQQIEQRFCVGITDDDFTPENFSTIASLSRLIDRRTTDGAVNHLRPPAR